MKAVVRYRYGSPSLHGWSPLRPLRTQAEWHKPVAARRACEIRVNHGQSSPARAVADAHRQRRLVVSRRDVAHAKHAKKDR